MRFSNLLNMNDTYSLIKETIRKPKTYLKAVSNNEEYSFAEEAKIKNQSPISKSYEHKNAIEKENKKLYRKEGHHRINSDTYSINQIREKNPDTKVSEKKNTMVKHHQKRQIEIHVSGLPSRIKHTGIENQRKPKLKRIRKSFESVSSTDISVQRNRKIKTTRKNKTEHSRDFYSKSSNDSSIGNVSNNDTRQQKHKTKGNVRKHENEIMRVNRGTLKYIKKKTFTTDSNIDDSNSDLVEEKLGKKEATKSKNKSLKSRSTKNVASYGDLPPEKLIKVLNNIALKNKKTSEEEVKSESMISKLLENYDSQPEKASSASPEKPPEFDFSRPRPKKANLKSELNVAEKKSENSFSDDVISKSNKKTYFSSKTETPSQTLETDANKNSVKSDDFSIESFYSKNNPKITIERENLIQSKVKSKTPEPTSSTNILAYNDEVDSSQHSDKIHKKKSEKKRPKSETHTEKPPENVEKHKKKRFTLTKKKKPMKTN